MEVLFDHDLVAFDGLVQLDRRVLLRPLRPIIFINFRKLLWKFLAVVGVSERIRLSLRRKRLLELSMTAS